MQEQNHVERALLNTDMDMYIVIQPMLLPLLHVQILNGYNPSYLKETVVFIGTIQEVCSSCYNLFSLSLVCV